MKRIVLTVTNDLVYDQRMQRISTTLANAGYEVLLVGRHLPHSRPVEVRPYDQVRLHCKFQNGPAFYAEYNWKLYRFLMKEKFDAVCAVDLDTVIPCFRAGKRKKAHCLYDAHELFTEMKEVRSRPVVHRIWSRVERFAFENMDAGFTVSEGLSQIFKDRYGREMIVVRNMPVKRNYMQAAPVGDPYLLYQGAVNEGRGFEWLIPAMRRVDARMVVCGDGNFMTQLNELIQREGVTDKISLPGMRPPDELPALAAGALFGINLTEPEGLNQLHCLPNKFFDYVMAGIPQLTNNYPEYKKLNAQYEVALLLPEMTVEAITTGINKLLQDRELYARLKQNAELARMEWTWNMEAPKLLAVYEKIFDHA
jgi:glycosyltransferase involved in cell wall biosynthesis